MSYVFLDVSIGKAPSNRLVIELFDKDAPQTCKFFKSLLSHPNGYKDTRFHRVIEEFMIQGGDINLENISSTERTPDIVENSNHPVDKQGLVGLARTGATESNSQFFITLVPADHLRGVHAIFGKVVKGIETVEKISQVEVDNTDTPTPGNEAVIVNCGELQPRKARGSPPRESQSTRKLQESNGKRKERSRSPRRDSEHHRRRSRSPDHRNNGHRRLRSSDDGGSDHPRRHQHHHRRHHHGLTKTEEPSVSVDRRTENRSETPEPKGSVRRQGPKTDSNEPRGNIPTGPRGYTSHRRYQPESTYGRLTYDGYDDDIRDDESHLQAAERRRDEERGRDGQIITFKGRGAMKYCERYY